MAKTLSNKRTSAYKPWLAWYCGFALLWTLFLLYAGGFTTSIHAGMAFLDWPLSHGSVNPEGWMADRDMRAEHGHRLLGAKVGLLMLGLFAWLWLREERRWVRRLGAAAVVMVVVQGLLGGFRVLFDELNIATDSNVVAQTFAVMHACLGQIFLCLLVTIAVVCSRPWIENKAGLRAPVEASTRWWGVAACAAIGLQLVIGAVMRHNHAALAIPTFPWSSPYNTVLPLSWTFPVSIHFAHRAGAIVVTVCLLVFAWKLWRSRATGPNFLTGSVAITAFLGVQIFLGALTVLTLKNEYVATLHMLLGAFLLALTWMLTFVCYRLPLEQTAAAPADRLPVPSPESSGGAARA